MNSLSAEVVMAMSRSVFKRKLGRFMGEHVHQKTLAMVTKGRLHMQRQQTIEFQCWEAASGEDSVSLFGHP